MSYLVKKAFGDYELNPFKMFDSFFDKSNTMKTDIKEADENYVFKIDMPGYNKDNITIEVDNGYLTVSGTTDNEVEKKDDEGNFICQERYSGSCSRSYYVGNIDEKEVKAKLENGILYVTYPKESKKINTENRIAIE